MVGSSRALLRRLTFVGISLFVLCSLVEASCSHGLFSSHRHVRRHRSIGSSKRQESNGTIVGVGSSGEDAGGGLENSEETPALPNFGYNATSNPFNWHTLDPAFEACGSGINQSPIILESGLITKIGKKAVFMDIPHAKEVILENLGTAVEVVVSGTTKVEGEDWNLRQFHFHTPSEHRIDSQHFDAELHFVHEAADGSGRIAVVAFLVNSAWRRRSTAFLEDVASYVGDIADPGSSTILPELDLSLLSNLTPETSFFTYSGSLTTPPCSEGVTWYISSTLLSIDGRSYNAIKRVVGTNNRFTQNRLGESNLLAATQAPPPG